MCTEKRQEKRSTIKNLSAFPVVLLAFFISCSIAPELTKEEKALVEKPPAPYTRVSPTTVALKHFGIMLAAFDVPSELVLQGKVVENKTACRNLPLDITDMIKTAVNAVGSNVRYAVFHPEYILLEVKTGSTTIGRKLPTLIIDGAITECDEDLDMKRSGVEANVLFGGDEWETDVEGGIGKEVGYSRIALDLHLVDYQTNLLVPYKQTSMAVDVWQLRKEREFGFMVHGSGLGIDGQRKVVQGKHNAVRALAELSVLQLLGKYYEIPYWRCLEGAVEDPEVIEMIKKRFIGFSEKEKIGQIQTLLGKHGYNINPTGKMDTQTREAIVSFAAKDDSLGEGIPGADLYTRLYVSLPVSFSKILPETLEKKPALSKAWEKPSPSSLNLQLAFAYEPTGTHKTRIFNRGDTLRSGDKYKLIIMPEEDCYLYVFQVDSTGNLFMLFPFADLKEVSGGNPNPLSSRNTYMLPGRDAAFFLDQNRGAEKIYLLASREKDDNIERLKQLLSSTTEPEARKKVEEIIYKYIKSKEVVQKISQGETIRIKGETDFNDNPLVLTRLTDLSKDKIYLFEFQHE